MRRVWKKVIHYSTPTSQILNELFHTYQESRSTTKPTNLVSTQWYSVVFRTLSRHLGTCIALFTFLLLFIIVYKRKRLTQRQFRKQNFKALKQQSGVHYDICVIGGGPAGSTSAYYLAKSGLKVLLIEKNRFPSDKICGDIISPTAQPILQEMGVLQDLMQEGIGRWISSGGLISPSGTSFIAEFNSFNDLSVQRILLDHRLSNAAQRQGVHLLSMNVDKLDPPTQMNDYWAVHCSSQSIIENSVKQFQSIFYARMIVAADGSNSELAKNEGLVSTKPNALFSRSFAKPGTHQFRADFAMFHPKELLPGFFIISREVEDYLSICCYLMPGGSVDNEEEFSKVYQYVINNNEHIRGALGNEVELTPVKCIPVRVGGVKKLYKDQFIIVGNAAGHLDPLNGQGIQYAMVGGQIAAKTIIQGFECGNLSSSFLKQYQTRVNHAFGNDLWMASCFAKLFYYFPSIIDATTSMVKRNGNEPLKLWLMIRSGEGSKFQFVRPDFIAMIVIEFIYLQLQVSIKKFFRNLK